MTHEKSEFKDRLEQLIGQKSVTSFGQKCGIGESSLRKYLHGSMPGLDKLIAIANASGVNIEWLATGRGPMRPGDTEKSTQVEREAKERSVSQADLNEGKGAKHLKPGGEEQVPQSAQRQADHPMPSDSLGLGESVELLAKIYNSGNTVLIRAIAANLHAFSEAVDNKALAQKAIDMMEEMNRRILSLEKDLAKLKEENKALRKKPPGNNQQALG